MTDQPLPNTVNVKLTPTDLLLTAQTHLLLSISTTLLLQTDINIRSAALAGLIDKEIADNSMELLGSISNGVETASQILQLFQQVSEAVKRPAPAQQ
jgi:hypothetical protein